MYIGCKLQNARQGGRRRWQRWQRAQTTPDASFGPQVSFFFVLLILINMISMDTPPPWHPTVTMGARDADASRVGFFIFYFIFYFIYFMLFLFYIFIFYNTLCITVCGQGNSLDIWVLLAQCKQCINFLFILLFIYILYYLY